MIIECGYETQIKRECELSVTVFLISHFEKIPHSPKRDKVIDIREILFHNMALPNDSDLVRFSVWIQIDAATEFMIINGDSMAIRLYFYLFEFHFVLFALILEPVILFLIEQLMLSFTITIS